MKLPSLDQDLLVLPWLALKKKKIAKKIVGIDISKKNLNDALKNKSIDEGRLKIDKRIERSDVIFICTPVSIIDEIALNQFFHIYLTVLL